MKGRLKELRISGSRIANHSVSPFITYCNAFIDEAHRDEETVFMRYLSQRGVSHENTVVNSLPEDRVLCPKIDPKEAFKVALFEMSKGTSYLFNFPFYNVPNNFIGFIDLLEKVEGTKSIFGEYYYRVIEIKSAKRIKEKHILQAAYYNLLLGEIQGYTPVEFHLINSENKREVYNYSNYSERIQSIINSIYEIYESNQIPAPILDLRGNLYPWSKYSTNSAIANNDISLLSGIGGKKRQPFIDAGFDTIRKVANSEISKLVEIKGVATKSATKYKQQAQVLTNSSPSIMSNEFFDIKGSGNQRIYLDIENTIEYFAKFEDTIECIYLYGILIEDKNEKKEASFFIEKPDDLEERKRIFCEFVKLLNQYPETNIYHWGYHEKTHLKKEAEKLRVVNEFNQIKHRLIDISSIFKKSIILPVYTYSVKDVSKYLGYVWEDIDMEGSATIFMYLSYLNSKNENIKNTLIRYNLDDVKAMSHIVNSDILILND